MPKRLVCDVCRQRTTKYQYVAVSFRGFRFSVFKPGGICYRCFKKELIGKIRYLEAKGCFKVSALGVFVDWEKCLKIRSDQGESGDDWERILSRLENLGVLSYLTAGNYMVMQDGSQLAFHGGPDLYFTDSNNADDFVKAYAKRRGRPDSFEIKRFVD
ncbi:MAG: hypothetical protein WC517_03995 [Patescibacteria group bacterium]